MICNVFKHSLKSQILLARPLKNCLNQADAHLLLVASCWLSKRSSDNVTTSLCLGRFWKPMELATIADKFWYMLTRTGATCLRLCRAENLKVRPLHPSTYWYFLLCKNSTMRRHQQNTRKLNKNSFHRPLLLASYHSRQNRVRVLFLAILSDLFVIVQCIAWYISIISVFASGLDFLPSVF